MSSMNIPTIWQEYRRLITTKTRWFRAQYPYHKLIVEDVDNANSIHAFNRFEGEGQI